MSGTALYLVACECEELLVLLLSTVSPLDQTHLKLEWSLRVKLSHLVWHPTMLIVLTCHYQLAASLFLVNHLDPITIFFNESSSFTFSLISFVDHGSNY